MDLDLISADDGKVKSSINIDADIFDVEYNETLVHQLVTAYQAGGRAGTKAQKNRSAVSGGGAKPWRQKGTGRARSGTSRSPIWRSGGVTFAASPRDYRQKVNKKMYSKGIKVILSQLVREKRFLGIEDVEISEPKTKQLAGKLKEMNIAAGMFVSDKDEANFEMASRNIPRIHLVNLVKLNPLCLVASECVYITQSALKKLEESLK
jgi:large subunit ribosomal protein L4